MTAPAEPTIDVLGAPYTAQTIPLTPDAEGERVATLVRRPPAPGTTDGTPGRAVLYLHGFVDYFFQKELGNWWAQRGYTFYALDLHKHGRYLRPHHTPYYTQNLTDYYPDINAAWRIITRNHGHTQVALAAHSTGGLTASLWAHDTRPTELTGLVLNSPWLDHFDGPLTRTVSTQLARTLATIKPRTILQAARPDPAAENLHASYGGEWNFNTDWKTLDFPPIYAGWLAAIRAGQARLHRGLDIQVPVLVLTSARSGRMRTRTQPHTFDAVLNVDHIRRWAPALGKHVTLISVPDAVHDVVLSAPAVRATAYRHMATWADTYLP